MMPNEKLQVTKPTVDRVSEMMRDINAACGSGLKEQDLRGKHGVGLF